ncbi:AAC(3) family N-acetyltransferase [bacterium]|nr:AAC(3) family N-acetyltransferase [bacterium]
MSEADAVKRSTDGPVTRAWLVRDLQALGVREGMLLMVHSSLSGLGWVIGGPVTVIDALEEVLGPDGTLVLPTFDGGNSDPINWQDPPIPASWHETFREQLPAYDPQTSPTRIMGALPDYFRTLPGVLRSAHPAQSWAARGPLAEQVIADHSLDCGDGSRTPLGRCYENAGYVLTLATNRTTILHLADFRTEWPGKHDKQAGSAMLVAGRRQWVTYADHWSDGEDFEQIRRGVMQAHPAGPDTWQAGRVCYGDSRLFKIKPLVDFALDWIPQHRRTTD